MQNINLDLYLHYGLFAFTHTHNHIFFVFAFRLMTADSNWQLVLIVKLLYSCSKSAEYMLRVSSNIYNLYIFLLSVLSVAHIILHNRMRCFSEKIFTSKPGISNFNLNLPQILSRANDMIPTCFSTTVNGPKQICWQINASAKFNCFSKPFVRNFLSKWSSYTYCAANY